MSMPFTRIRLAPERESTAAARELKAAGTFSDAPFLLPANVFSVTSAPDLIATGDFNADGHLDIVTARQGDTAISFLPGDGNGAFGSTQAVTLPGAVTAL